MKKVFVVIVIAAFVALIAFGCDTRQAGIERAKKRFKMTPEEEKLQADSYAKVKESCENYKQDFGEYPKTLDELKAQGYEVPEPNEGWTWEYRSDSILGPQLQPVPKQ